MRFHVSSLPRAVALAKSLRALLAGQGIPVTGGQAKAMTARMLGYEDWAELKLVTLRGKATPSLYDEGCSPAAVDLRRAYQARRLAEALQGFGQVPPDIDALLAALAPTGKPSARTRHRPALPVGWQAFPPQAMHPLMWLSANGISLKEGIAFDEAATRSALSRQLERPWKGYAALAAHEKILAAAFAMHAEGRRDEALALVDLDDETYLEHLPGRVGQADRYFADPANAGALEYLDGSHAYVATAMTRMLRDARHKAGILASASFCWLRGVDRGLWYALNNLGRKSFFVEGIAAVIHFRDEMTLGTAIGEASVDDAVTGIRSYLARPDAQAWSTQVRPA